jgi:hypothetical protein
MANHRSYDFAGEASFDDALKGGAYILANVRDACLLPVRCRHLDHGRMIRESQAG